MNPYILHITTPNEWEAVKADSHYKAPSLQTEGFIHCSTFSQVLGVVNQWFKGQNKLLLLVIDQEKLTYEVKFEDLYNHGDHFPHLYGPLNTNAVIAQVPLVANSTGQFEFPADLLQYQSNS